MKLKRRFLVAGLVLTLIAGLFVGRYRITTINDFLNLESLFWRLLLEVRLPRVLLALLAGAGLAVSGLVFQTIFRNPLADAGIMGISQGAGFGASLGILFFENYLFGIQGFSFLFSLLALSAAIFLSNALGRDKVLSLVLSGLAISAFFSSGLGIIKYMADPINQLPNIVFWLLGSLKTASWEILLRSSALVIPLLVFFYFYRWRLNIHSLDKSVSFSLGMKRPVETNFILSAAALLVAAIISFTGIVSWVGLIIPNYSRVLFGADTSKTMINAMLLGGIFMVLCDMLARALLPGEIPLGIFSALLGSGLFVSLLIRRRLFS